MMGFTKPTCNNFRELAAARLHRFVAQEGFKIVGHLIGRVVAQIGWLLYAARHDHFQITIYPWLEQPDRGRIMFQILKR